MTDKMISVVEGNNLYAGRVEIKLTKKNKSPYKVVKKHNASTEAFHSYILKSLMGTSQRIERIYGIKLFKDTPLVSADDTLKPESSNIDIALFSNSMFPGVAVTEDPEKITDNISGLTNAWRVEYHFLVPQSFLNNQEVKQIVLCNTKGEAYAWVNTTVTEEGEEVPLKLVPGYNLDVSWTIIISSLSNDEGENN